MGSSDRHPSSPRRAVPATMWSSDVKRSSTRDPAQHKGSFLWLWMGALYKPGQVFLGVAVNTWEDKRKSPMLLLIINNNCGQLGSGVFYLYKKGRRQSGCRWFPEIHLEEITKKACASVRKYFLCNVSTCSVHLPRKQSNTHFALFIIDAYSVFIPRGFTAKHGLAVALCHKSRECRTQTSCCWQPGEQYGCSVCRHILDFHSKKKTEWERKAAEVSPCDAIGFSVQDIFLKKHLVLCDGLNTGSRNRTEHM